MILLKEAIEKIISKNNLSEMESYALMKDIFTGAVPSTQIASFLTALRCKGETTDEITGFVKAMREAMIPIKSEAPIIIDTCGTGGDGKGTFNISTASAFVVAGANFSVAKHGNRSISSRCGSADVLEALGVNVEMPKETAEICLNKIGITFLFAPFYHPAMKTVGPARKEMGIRTIFNILGPLINPAGANVQVVGVPKKELLVILSKVFKKLNSNSKSTAIVAHDNGYDEIVLSGKGRYSLIKDGTVSLKNFPQSVLKLKKMDLGTLNGGDAKQNAEILKQIFTEKEHPLKDVVLANASLAIYGAKLLSSGKREHTLLSAFNNAKDSLASGRALEKLKQLVEWSHKV